MPLYRCSAQKRLTLKGHYEELLSDPQSKLMGEEMLEFIQKVEETFTKTTIWALTSHYQLVLQKKDDWESDWLIIITGLGTKEFGIEYLVPEQEAPWPNAYIKGTAKSLNEAIKYLKIAMIESRGWTKDEIE